jgi:hypothetical protein
MHHEERGICRLPAANSTGSSWHDILTGTPSLRDILCGWAFKGWGRNVTTVRGLAGVAAGSTKTVIKVLGHLYTKRYPQPDADNQLL